MKKIKIILSSMLFVFTLMAVLGFGLKAKAAGTEVVVYDGSQISAGYSGKVAIDSTDDNITFTLGSSLTYGQDKGTQDGINFSSSPNTSTRECSVLVPSGYYVTSFKVSCDAKTNIRTLNISTNASANLIEGTTTGSTVRNTPTEFELVQAGSKIDCLSSDTKIYFYCSGSVAVYSIKLTVEAPATYNVSYSTTVGETPETRSLAKLDEEALPKLSEDGYIFNGWKYEAGEFAKVGDEVTADIVLYADWTDLSLVTNYQVTFNNDGVTSSVQIVENAKITEWPDTSSLYKTFIGWFDEEENAEYTADTPITKDVTLVAHYSENDVITYSADLFAAMADEVAETTLVFDENLTLNKLSTGSPFQTKYGEQIVQCQEIQLKIKATATVTLSVAQTGSNKNRYLHVETIEGKTILSGVEPPKDGKSLTDVALRLDAGTYVFKTYGNAVNKDAKFQPEGMFNYASIVVDYSKSSGTTQSFIMYNQEGVTASEDVKAVRFVGVLENVSVEDITSINLSLVRKLADKENPDEAVVKEINNVYTSLKDNGNYVFEVVDGKLYFYYAITGLTDEVYTGSTITCTAMITLANNQVVANTTTFTYGG